MRKRAERRALIAWGLISEGSRGDYDLPAAAVLAARGYVDPEGELARREQLLAEHIASRQGAAQRSDGADREAR